MEEHEWAGAEDQEDEDCEGEEEEAAELRAAFAAEGFGVIWGNLGGHMI